MSDTDDTEELLNYSPNSISLDPNLYFDNVPCFGLVDNLISQVNTLEKRVKSIETMSEPSWKSNSLDEISKFRNKGSYDDLNSISVQSTPNKRLWRPLATSSPSVSTTSTAKEKSVPRKLFDGERPMENSLTLEEVDNFITNLNILKHVTNSSNTPTNSSSTPDTLNFAKHSNCTTIYNEAKSSTKQPENVDSSRYPVILKTSSLSKSSETNSNFSQSTIYEKFDFTIEESKTGFQNNQPENNHSLESMSLSHLWNRTGSSPKRITQQLQEEKLKRQHCEETIKELQSRLLDLEEKLSVAIQVDGAKDTAINKMFEEMQKLTVDYRKLQEEKLSVENELENIKQNFRAENAKAEEKIAQCEKEIAKVMNYAQFNKEKHVELEMEMINMKSEYENIKDKLEEAEEKYMLESDRSKKYSELLTQKDLELEQMNMKLSDAVQQIAKSNISIEVLKNETNSLKDECNGLRAKLENRTEQWSKLNKEKEDLIEKINTYKNLEKNLRNELEKTKNEMESNKQNLKHYYQGQVELVVQSKLKEFQKQLEAAEKSLKEDFLNKEASMSKMASSRIHDLSENYNKEIKLLEEKHKEENKLFKLQLCKLNQDLEITKSKLKKEQDKHLQIESELFKFMKTLKQDESKNETSQIISKPFSDLEDFMSVKSSDKSKDKKS